MTLPAIGDSTSDALCIDCGDADRSRLIVDIGLPAGELGGATEAIPVSASIAGLRVKLPADAVSRMRASLHLIGASAVGAMLAEPCSGLLVMLAPSDKRENEDQK